MKFSELLDSFSGTKTVVLGDVMLDAYIFGTIDRISPEAPVMVVNKREERWVPGGAANVAMNVSALGGTAVVGGVVGNDRAGKLFLESLGECRGLTSFVVVSSLRPTTSKTRVVANHAHQVLRIDEEVTFALVESERTEMLRELVVAMDHADCLILSDYQKGVLDAQVVAEAIKAAKTAGVPVVVNAKPASAHIFRGATVLTLNKREAEAASGQQIHNRADALRIAEGLRHKLEVECMVVTLGEGGMVATWEGGETTAHAPQVEAYDVAGAGDTALAALALGIVSMGFNPLVFQLAVWAAASVVQHVGVAVPTDKDLQTLRSLT